MAERMRSGGGEGLVTGAGEIHSAGHVAGKAQRGEHLWLMPQELDLARLASRPRAGAARGAVGGFSMAMAARRASLRDLHVAGA